MDPNLVFLNSFLDVSQDTFSKLKSIGEYKSIEAGERVVKAGDVPTSIYLLTFGMMRSYLSSENGKAFNKNFFMPYSFVGALTGLIKKEPSQLSYEALTMCHVYEVNFDDFLELCKEDLVISNLYNRVLEHVYIKNEDRHLEFISMDAKARYLSMCKKLPDIEALVPQYHIASYLSITPVQLSRIRRTLKMEGEAEKVESVDR